MFSTQLDVAVHGWSGNRGKKEKKKGGTHLFEPYQKEQVEVSGP
jgi:hypothetical protein